MAREHHLNQRLSHDRTHLRVAVLHIGSLLGWKVHEVIGFTEALTGCAWRHCGPDEFQLVLDEYLALGQLIGARATRHRARNDRPAEVMGGRDAAAE